MPLIEYEINNSTKDRNTKTLRSRSKMSSTKQDLIFKTLKKTTERNLEKLHGFHLSKKYSGYTQTQILFLLCWLLYRLSTTHNTIGKTAPDNFMINFKYLQKQRFMVKNGKSHHHWQKISCHHHWPKISCHHHWQKISNDLFSLMIKFYYLKFSIIRRPA